MNPETRKFVPKSNFVRQAIEEKIRRGKFRQLENEWIEALKKNPENTKKIKAWIKAESWER